MSVPPGWILKALAGSGNDVAWSGIDPRLCRFITRTVTTPMYPFEPIEDMAANAQVLGGWAIEVQQESFYAPHAILTAGEVVKIYEPVSHAHGYESFYAPHAILTDGLVYTVYNPVTHTHGYESFYSPHAILTDGVVWGGVQARAPNEDMTTGLTEITGELT